MMRRVLICLALLLPLFSPRMGTATVSATGQLNYSAKLPLVYGSGSPPASSPSVYWGLYTPDIPYDMVKLDAYEKLVQKGMSIIQFGRPWQMNGSFLEFPTAQLNNVRQHGAIPMIHWGSWDLGRGPEQPDFRLNVITSGRYDAYIRAWAESAKAWGYPFFLKFDWEMDGRWQFPWSVQLNGNQPQDFVPMWRHVYNIFREVGATNVTWVWCVTTASRNSVPMQPLYPGDAYVDWTCLHGYNFGGSNWRSFSEVFRGYPENPFDSYQMLLDLAPTKPIMIGEWATTEAWDNGVRKSEWITDALTRQIPYNFPQVKAVVWFNWNPDPAYSWVVESSPAALQAFKNGISSPIYASNTFSLLNTSPIPPLRR